jgi:hypothetical protein
MWRRRALTSSGYASGTDGAARCRRSDVPPVIILKRASLSRADDAAVARFWCQAPSAGASEGRSREREPCRPPALNYPVALGIPAPQQTEGRKAPRVSPDTWGRLHACCRSEVLGLSNDQACAHRLHVGKFSQRDCTDKTRGVWIAVGEYVGELIEVTDRSEASAVARWEETARHKRAEPAQPR